jgi:flagellar hook-associated protein 3 FlgL
MRAIPSFIASQAARSDLARLSDELTSLQRQSSSGFKAADLKGYGSDLSRVVQTRSLLTAVEGRKAAIAQWTSRAEVQDAVLSSVESAVTTLRTDITSAISRNDASTLYVLLESAYDQTVDALNETYDGHALFGGERRDSPTVTATSLSALTQTNEAQLFNESVFDARAQFGAGDGVRLADRASTFSKEVLSVMRELANALKSAPQTQPLSQDLREDLLSLSSRLADGHKQVLAAQARNGETMNRLKTETDRISARSDLLTKNLGAYAEKDLAEVAMRLSSAQTQYQAIAKVFGQVRDLSLVNFLK